MNNHYIKLIINSLLIAIVGVFIVDYFFHLFFSQPMETLPYFMAKMTLYFIFSIIFLSLFNLNKNEFIKAALVGIVVASLWGLYYNIFPAIFNYYPFGISLRGLTFLGLGLFGTGLAFGIIHALAFIAGYYSAKFICKNLLTKKSSANNL